MKRYINLIENSHTGELIPGSRIYDTKEDAERCAKLNAQVNTRVVEIDIKEPQKIVKYVSPAGNVSQVIENSWAETNILSQGSYWTRLEES